MNINNAIPSEWGSYITQSPVGLEVIPAVLYDTETYVDNTTRELLFFNSTAAKTRAATNLKQPGMLPNPQSFLIQNIRLYFKTRPQSDPSGAADSAAVVSEFDNLVQLVNFGVYDFQIGEKQYGPWPLWMLAAANFIKGAFATGSDLVADYGQIDGPLYPLLPNLMIAPLQPFFVKLSWPDGALNLTGNVIIQTLFDGQMARAIQ